MAEEKTISGDDLEKLTLLTDRQHRNIAKLGYFPPPRNGQYLMVVTIKGMFKYREDEAKKQHGEMHQTLLDRAKDKARRERVEADKAEELVVDKADMQRTVTRFALALKFKCIALCKKVANRMAVRTDPIEIEQDLLREMREIFESVKFDYGLTECPKCKTPIEP